MITHRFTVTVTSDESQPCDMAKAALASLGRHQFELAGLRLVSVTPVEPEKEQRT